MPELVVSRQNLDRQIVELKKYMPEECIVMDKASGKNLDRSGYHALKGPLGLSGNLLSDKIEMRDNPSGI